MGPAGRARGWRAGLMLEATPPGGTGTSTKPSFLGLTLPILPDLNTPSVMNGFSSRSEWKNKLGVLMKLCQGLSVPSGKMN